MWVAQLRASYKGSAVLEESRSADAEMAVHYLHAYPEDGQTQVCKAGVFSGVDAEKLRRSLSGDANVKILGQEGDQVFFCSKSDAFHSAILNRRVFFVKPAVVKGGFEHWTVASWRKEDINDFYNQFKNEVELLSVKKQAVNLFADERLGSLTRLQKHAIETAVSEGYYHWPRKANLEQIAFKHGIARTTLQHRLRHAERKLVHSVVSGKW